MHYSEDQATAYGNIALEKSTFAVSLIPAISSFRDLTGTTVLDFGAGAGRSARALRDRGAQRVVAVDKDANMLKVARRYPGISYIQIGQALPIIDRSIGAALCANVFSEFKAIEDITAACREVWRVLSTDGIFVIIVTSPHSVYSDYKSYRYENVTNPTSGSPITCLIKGPERTLIQDYYWSADDYTAALQAAGFEVERLLLPIAAPDNDWLDETRVAPDLVIRSRRIS